jgi:RNA polymerase sigma-70 factor (family 1)
MPNKIILSLDDLVSRLKAGDEQAFGEIYNFFWKPLYKTALNIVRDEDTASDAIQEVFVSLWQRREELNIISIKAYLQQSVRFSVLKAIRAQKTDQQFYQRLSKITTEIIFENPLLTKEYQILIDTLINKLPPDCKEIFLLSRYEGLIYRHIAERLNISEKTVEKKMTKSLKLLREGLSLELCLLIIFLVC